MKASPSLIAMTLFLSTAPLPAAPPNVTALTPRGAQRGQPVEIVVTGTNLSPQAKLLVPFQAQQEVLLEPKPNPAQLRLRLTIDPAVPCGIYPLRLMDDGVSSVVLFAVETFSVVNEVEDNNTAAKAQVVPTPCIVNGQCSGGDVDHYRFAARKGQRLILETHASRLGAAVLPLLRVTDVRGRFLALEDRQALDGDGRLDFTAPDEGDYLVEICDTRFRGGNPPFYLLQIAETDFVEEIFPLGGRRGDNVEFVLRGGTLTEERRVVRPMVQATDLGGFRLGLDGLLRPGFWPPLLTLGDFSERVWSQPQSDKRDPRSLDVLPPVTINGRFEQRGEMHRFQFPVQAGQKFRLNVQAETLGSALDGVLKVSDQTGKQIALADDIDVPPPATGLGPSKSVDPSLDVTVPAATSLLVVELRDQRNRGGINFGYRLSLSPATPDFTLQSGVTEINVPRGGSASLNVTVTRRGFTGPVQLNVPNLPAGLVVQGGHVPPNGGAGVLTITAADPSPLPPGPMPLTVEGRATIEGGELRRKAEVLIVQGREGNTALSVLPLPHVTLGLTGPDPFTVKGPPTVEVVRGYPLRIPITLTRAADQAMLSVEVTATVPTTPGQPPPLTFQPATAASDIGLVNITLTPAATAPDEQVLDMVVQGKAKIGNVDRIVTGPAVAVTVLRPFTVEAPATAVPLTAGQSATIKVKIRRQPVFKEPVQVKLDGLPAGVTLSMPLKPLPPEADELAVELKADVKAVTATVNLTLTCSTTIAGTVFNHPVIAIPVQVK